MTCLEAQSKIIAYIDYKLEKEEKIAFLKHIKNCENCREELNIYYTMLIGMRQLDENSLCSIDFTKELQERMEKELTYNKHKKSFLRSSFILTIIGIVSFAVFGYMNFLNLLWEDEQKQLKQAQGEYYYSEYFSENMFKEESHIIEINLENQKDTEFEFFQKIRNQKMLEK